MTPLLIVTQDRDAARAIKHGFDDAPVHEAASLEAVAPAPDRNEAPRFDYAFIDARLLPRVAEDGDHSDPGERLRAARRAAPGARIVVLVRPESIREAVGLVRAGASDYLTYPISAEEVRLVRDELEHAERTRSELRYLRDRVWQREAAEPVRCRSEAMQAVLHKVRQVAATRSTVLLTGETGTGKSYLARLIHAQSNRGERQLISVHCGAIPDTLLESELFGHERGAFTGAVRRKLGKFEIANSGTLFLDEVATLSAAMQVKLLNVLQERSFQRVGGEATISVDIRVLAATNMDLARLVADGSFRADLYYRLNVFPIELPPLRDRREDIPDLAELFLTRLRTDYAREIHTIDPRVLDALLAYPWPGNVRELENLIERAFILETSSALRPSSFPDELLQTHAAASPEPTLDQTLADVRRRAIAHAERHYLERQLAANHGRIDATAHAAGITPRQLHTLMTRHSLRKESFRE